MKNDGTEMQKISSSTFVDGQEVEQVFVTSPFIPNPAKRQQNFIGSLPGVYVGWNIPTGGAFGFTGADEMHVKDFSCGEFGISTINLGLPFNNLKTFGLVTALQLGYSTIHFDKHYQYAYVDGKNEVIPIVSDKKLKKSWMNYCYIRIPVLLEWQKKFNNSQRFIIGAGLSVSMRSAIHSRYKDEDGRHSVTKEINMNAFGLGFDAHVGYTSIQLYFHTDLTPLLNTDKAPKCYNTSLGIGFCI